MNIYIYIQKLFFHYTRKSFHVLFLKNDSFVESVDFGTRFFQTVTGTIICNTAYVFYSLEIVYRFVTIQLIQFVARNGYCLKRAFFFFFWNLSPFFHFIGIVFFFSENRIVMIRLFLRRLNTEPTFSLIIVFVFIFKLSFNDNRIIRTSIPVYEDIATPPADNPKIPIITERIIKYIYLFWRCAKKFHGVIFQWY